MSTQPPPAQQETNVAPFGEALSAAQLERLRGWLIDTIPHSTALGLALEDMSRGRAVISLPWARHLVGNPDTGVLAGGAITALLDSVSGAAVASLMREVVPFATLDLRIDYNRPAEPNRKVIAEAECYRLTSNIAFTRAIAHHGDPTSPVAAATGTFMMTGMMPGAPPRPPAGKPIPASGAAPSNMTHSPAKGSGP